jgi:hypothetical protein
MGDPGNFDQGIMGITLLGIPEKGDRQYEKKYVKFFNHRALKGTPFTMITF